MNEIKIKLRIWLKSKRLQMPIKTRQQASRKICEKLQSEINWVEVSNVHVFEPIESLGEVDLRELYEWLAGEYPGIVSYTSKKIGSNWHVTKLNDSSPAEPQNLDLVIVPMLGFDKSLNRIGYGIGYYDKLLKAYPLAQKIGVCFEAGKTQRIPTEPHDVRLNQIITEEQVYRLRQSTP